MCSSGANIEILDTIFNILQTDLREIIACQTKKAVGCIRRVKSEKSVCKGVKKEQNSDYSSKSTNCSRHNLKYDYGKPLVIYDGSMETESASDSECDCGCGSPRKLGAPRKEYASKETNTLPEKDTTPKELPQNISSDEGTSNKTCAKCTQNKRCPRSAKKPRKNSKIKKRARSLSAESQTDRKIKEKKSEVIKPSDDKVNSDDNKSKSENQTNEDPAKSNKICSCNDEKNNCDSDKDSKQESEQSNGTDTNDQTNESPRTTTKKAVTKNNVIKNRKRKARKRKVRFVRSQVLRTASARPSSPSPEPMIARPSMSSTSSLCRPSTSSVYRPSTTSLCKPSTSSVCRPSTSSLCRPSTSSFCQPSTSSFCQPSTSKEARAQSVSKIEIKKESDNKCNKQSHSKSKLSVRSNILSWLQSTARSYYKKIQEALVDKRLDQNCIITERAKNIWLAVNVGSINITRESYVPWHSLKSWQKMPFYWAALSNELLSETPIDNFERFFNSSMVASSRHKQRNRRECINAWRRLTKQQKYPFIVEAFIAQVCAGRVNINNNNEVNFALKRLFRR